LWDRVQPTENEALRARLGLGAQTGVVVYRPESAADDYPLKKWDVITRIGDHPVDNQGNVKLRADLYVSFQYLVRKLAKEGRLGLTILRDGKALEVNVPVRSEKNLAVPFLSTKSARDCYPRYFVCGPLVFLSASQELAGGMTRASGGWIRMMAMAENPLLARLMDKPAFAGEEIVTLGYGLLPHKTSKGFSPPPFSVVSRVDGTPVRSLAHLVALIRDAKGEFLTIDLAGNSGPLVFRREEVLKATDEILADEGIRRQYSEDLEGVWRPKNP
jgi:hypothetical protein